MTGSTLELTHVLVGWGGTAGAFLGTCRFWHSQAQAAEARKRSLHSVQAKLDSTGGCENGLNLNESLKFHLDISGQRSIFP